jgi:hypothetical protein
MFVLLRLGGYLYLIFTFTATRSCNCRGVPRSSRFGTAGRGRISWQWDAEVVDCGVVYHFDMIPFIRYQSIADKPL